MVAGSLDDPAASLESTLFDTLLKARAVECSHIYAVDS